MCEDDFKQVTRLQMQMIMMIMMMILMMMTMQVLAKFFPGVPGGSLCPSSGYAHHVFTTMDPEASGTVNFEVRAPLISAERR